MTPIVMTATTAAGLFVGTNLDDMVMLVVLNMSSRAEGRPQVWQIWVGQVTGIAVLVAIALLAALGLNLVPERWIWLLGTVPLLLGLSKLFAAIRAHNGGDQLSPAVAIGLPGVIGLTIANGGDNIAAYTPVFRTLGPSDLAVTLAVFTLGVVAWCGLGRWLVTHHTITQLIHRWGHWIMPTVYIVIALYIFHNAGVLSPSPTPAADGWSLGTRTHPPGATIECHAS